MKSQTKVQKKFIARKTHSVSTMKYRSDTKYKDKKLLRNLSKKITKPAPLYENTLSIIE